MKITHNKVGQNLNLKDLNESGKAGSTAAAKGSAQASLLKESALSNLGNTSNDSTKVQLSERAQQMKKAKELAVGAPDIREDKVARLQKLIDEGNYSVSAKDVADKMVDEEAQWI